MINITDFDSIKPINKILDEELKQAIFLALQQIDPKVSEISLLDFTVYEGIGSYRAGPYHYNSEGQKMLEEHEQPIKQYIFETLPTLVIAGVYDHLNPSQFVIEKHPVNDYLVKVQLSENNHFQLLVFAQSVMILSVNGVEIVTLEALATPNAKINARNQLIHEVWQNGEPGIIPHKLASEFAQSTALYRREELENTPPWEIIETRNLTKQETWLLHQLNYQHRFLLPFFLILLSLFLIVIENMYLVLSGTILFLYGLTMLEKGKARIALTQKSVKVKGVLKSHPKVPYTGPIEAVFMHFIQTDQIQQHKKYEFNMLKEHKTIYRIDELCELKSKVIPKKNILSTVIVGGFSLLLLLSLWSSKAGPNEFKLGPVDKMIVSVGLVLKSYQPTTVINYSSDQSFVPKQFQKIKISSYIQCNNQRYIQLCDKVNLLPNAEAAMPVSIDPDDMNYYGDSELHYIAALNAHYLSLKPENAILLDTDFTHSPVFKIIARNHDYFYSYDSFDSSDTSLRHDLTFEGFEYLSQPIYTTLTGIVKQVDFIDTPKKRWEMHLITDFNGAQYTEMMAFSRYAISFLFAYISIIGYLVFIVARFFYRSRQIRTIQA